MLFVLLCIFIVDLFNLQTYYLIFIVFFKIFLNWILFDMFFCIMVVLVNVCFFIHFLNIFFDKKFIYQRIANFISTSRVVSTFIFSVFWVFFGTFIFVSFCYFTKIIKECPIKSCPIFFPPFGINRMILVVVFSGYALCGPGRPWGESYT